LNVDYISPSKDLCRTIQAVLEPFARNREKPASVRSDVMIFPDGNLGSEHNRLFGIRMAADHFGCGPKYFFRNRMHSVEGEELVIKTGL